MSNIEKIATFSSNDDWENDSNLKHEKGDAELLPERQYFFWYR